MVGNNGPHTWCGRRGGAGLLSLRLLPGHHHHRPLSWGLALGPDYLMWSRGKISMFFKSVILVECFVSDEEGVKVWVCSTLTNRLFRLNLENAI